MNNQAPGPNDCYVCHEQPDRYNPRARGRAAVRQDMPEGQEIAVITLSNYKVGAEKSPQDWATLFAAAPDMAEALKLLGEAVTPFIKQALGSNNPKVRNACDVANAALAKAGIQ